MRCNHCGIEFHSNKDFTLAHRNQLTKRDFIIEADICPACKQSNLFLIEGVFKHASSAHFGRDTVADVQWRRPIHPTSEVNNSLPKEVPNEYASLYLEACSVLPFSPRSAAALARRLLEAILIGQGAAKSKNLHEQISWCLQKGLPSYISDNLDNVRKVGKFAAHIKENVHTGEILEVEQGEAEFVLACIVDLCDFYFVLPARAKARSSAIQIKLEAIRGDSR